MSNIRLPKPFRNIINKEFNQVGYEILDAYVDEMEHKNLAEKGLKGLRELLGVKGDEVICDLFCEIKLNNGVVLKIIFEDKNSKHQKNIYDARKQLENTNKLLIEKGINIDYAVACTMSLEIPFKARKSLNNVPFKEVYLDWNRNHSQVLLGTRVPLLWSR